MTLLYLAMLENHEDESTFLELYRIHSSMLTRIGQRFFKENWFVEDALQLTWESVAKNFRKISSLPRHETAPYLVTMMKNKCRDILRSEKKYTELFPDEDAAIEDEIDETVIIKQEYLELVSLIRKMPDIYREVLERRLILEESNVEIAKNTGVSELVVAQRFSRGKAMLIKSLSVEVQNHE